MLHGKHFVWLRFAFYNIKSIIKSVCQLAATTINLLIIYFIANNFIALSFTLVSVVSIFSKLLLDWPTTAALWFYASKESVLYYSSQLLHGSTLDCLFTQLLNLIRVCFVLDYFRYASWLLSFSVYKVSRLGLTCHALPCLTKQQE